MSQRILFFAVGHAISLFLSISFKNSKNNNEAAFIGRVEYSKISQALPQDVVLNMNIKHYLFSSSSALICGEPFKTKGAWS